MSEMLVCDLCGESWQNQWSSKKDSCPDCRSASPDLTDFSNEEVRNVDGGADE